MKTGNLTKNILHLQQYFIANNIKEVEKQRAILLSACRQNTYKVICILVAPKKSRECNYNDILDHFKEKTAKFMAELQNTAWFCGYNATLEDMICDQLVHTWSE